MLIQCGFDENYELVKNRASNLSDPKGQCRLAQCMEMLMRNRNRNDNLNAFIGEDASVKDFPIVSPLVSIDISATTQRPDG